MHSSVKIEYGVNVFCVLGIRCFLLNVEWREQRSEQGRGVVLYFPLKAGSTRKVVSRWHSWFLIWIFPSNVTLDKEQKLLTLPLLGSESLRKHVFTKTLLGFFLWKSIFSVCYIQSSKQWNTLVRFPHVNGEGYSNKLWNYLSHSDKHCWLFSSGDALVWLNESESFSSDVPVWMPASQQQCNLIRKHGPEEEQSLLMFSTCILCLLTMYSGFSFIKPDYLPWGSTI